MTQPSPSDSAATSPPASEQAQLLESVERARAGDQNAFTQLFEITTAPFAPILRVL